MVMAAIRHWSLEDLHRLPADGNRYELLHGELFVTPPPTDRHETVLARLTRALEPYVAAHDLGYVYHPRSVIRAGGSELEPDLMVRQPHTDPGGAWDTAPIPILVVEVLSETTRRRDLGPKRAFYLELGVAEYWAVDPEARTVMVAHAGHDDTVASDTLTWTPPGVAEPLTLNLTALLPGTATG